MLKDKIGSLANSLRYRDIVNSYLRRMQADRQQAMENRYESVLASITKLWVDSSKNPSIFKDARDFEPILQRNRMYRDHFIHSFNVFLLGYYIINRLNETHHNKDFFKAREPNFNLTWMLTSTFHDVAYPIQETEFWLNELFEKFLGVNPKFSLNITQIVPMVYVDFIRLISCWHRQPIQGPLQGDKLMSMDWTFYNEIGSKLIEKEHGVVGALMLSHRMAIREGFLEEPIDSTKARNPWDFLYLHLPACHAISLHHLQSIPVSFSKHPFAFMLILCDELQDWGRPSNRRDRDIISLKNVKITETDPPEILFEIEASEYRKKELNEVLTRRLLDDGTIKTNIKNARETKK